MVTNNVYNYGIIAVCLTIFAISRVTHSTVCPDSRRQCDNDTTCCKLKSGVYGCCPLPSAQCCADGVHCCPSGTTCNDKEGTCDESHRDINKVKLKQLCPDRRETCGEGETCCKEKSGIYGCCLYEQAVCCADGEHCCPFGTECDVAHQRCVRRPSYRPNGHSNRIALLSLRVNVSDVICPGGQYQCPDSNTCCQVSDTEWGCCPLPNAVCCADKIHCCPQSTTCTPTGCQPSIK